MKKIFLLLCSFTLIFTACDDFLDITPNDKITDDGIWDNAVTVKMYINDVYNSLNGPLYIWSSRNNDDNIGGQRAIFDNFMTGDLWYNAGNLYNYSQWGKSTGLNALLRWEPCYKNIRKINTAIEGISNSTTLSEENKTRYLGDMYFMRANLYFELFRFYGKVPIIDKAQNRFEDEIFNERNKEIDVVNFIIADFEKAIEYLPKDISSSELGRATKGAAVGMLSTAYLYFAGVMPYVDDAASLTVQPREYYKKAYETADILINGELKGKYELFGKDATNKAEAFHNLFLEPNEYNEEVLFDIQFTEELNRMTDIQAISSPGTHGAGSQKASGGWGRNNPTQNIVDEFRMADGSDFDWNNPAQAADPFANREPRFYASILYNGVMWRGEPLYSSTNYPVYNESAGTYTLVENTSKKIGTNSYTQTGYYMKKHINPAVNYSNNRYAPYEGAGQNLIVLRYAEILLTYAEAKNEYSGPDATALDALNKVRNRGGLGNIPSSVGQSELRDIIRHERHVELAFENKRYFDIMRWRQGVEIIGKDVYGMSITFSLVNNKPVAKYNKILLTAKSFENPKNYLMPIPDAVTGRNPKLLPNNQGW